jgi:hypothetical protein
MPGFFPVVEDDGATGTAAAPMGQAAATQTPDGQSATEQPKKYAGKFESDADLEKGYLESEAAMRKSQQETAELRKRVDQTTKQAESDRALLQQLLAARNAEPGPKPEPEDDLLQTWATTMGVSPERIQAMIDGIVTTKVTAAEKKAENAAWRAMQAEAKAEDREIGQHMDEVNAYMQTHPAVFQTANPYLSAWNEIQAPVRQEQSAAEVEKKIAEAYKKGHDEAAAKAAGRMSPRGGGVAKDDKLTPIEKKGLALFGEIPHKSKQGGFFPPVIDE